jgi:DNA-binding FadR family transcriptional regulator
VNSIVEIMSSRLHTQILDRLGTAITSGEISAGTVLRVVDLSQQFDVSLPVMREAVRVLQAVGLVSLTKRVGLRVLPEQHWNALEPLVIRWRLESPGRETFLQSLIELRRVVEPAAARLAAGNGSDEDRRRLIGAADAMRETSRNPDDRAAYFDADVTFHTALMSAGGNPLFASLTPAVIEALRGRSGLGIHDDAVQSSEVELHAELAAAISDRDADAAESAGHRLLGGIERRLRH